MSSEPHIASPEDKENVSAPNLPDAKPSEPEVKKSNVPAAAPSPNTMRKRRREEIARKVESRKALITTASSSRLDMGKVHSILSGPRLSWDWQGGSSGANKHDAEEDDDSCGLIVDFHQDSRSALRTHISKAMSQMASRDISSQSTAMPLAKMKGNSEDIQQIIQMKRRLISSQAVPTAPAAQPADVLPELEPIDPENPPIHLWQETQMVPPSMGESDVVEPTQVFVRKTSPVAEYEEEEIVVEPVFDEIEPTQVYIPEVPAVEEVIKQSPPPTLQEEPSRASSIPPNSVRENSVSENESEESSSSSEEEASSESSSEEEPVVQSKAKPKSKSKELSFEEWLEERKRKKKQRKAAHQSSEAKAFFEAEAEESEDEELGGIMRRGITGGSDEEELSDDSDEDSDLEDLVASAEDEFRLLQKAGKDSNKLAKLHAKWLDERDEQLQKAIEEKDFWKKKGLRGLKGIDDGVEDGLNRMQRRRKARQDALVEKFDSEGNLLAPEYVTDESDYDSMEIDSDDFFDEFSDDENGGDQLDEHEIRARKERRERELERRKRDKEMKLEMLKRRQMLKEKLREERLMREKDKRELQAGLGIMAEEDREVFKLVSRTQGVFGYTQTTQSTRASTPSFSFLSAENPGKTIGFKSRRSSIGSLELE